MPGEDLKISTLTERVACEITGNEEFPTEVSNANFRIKLSSYLTWIITQLTTFVTLTGTQTLTNKTLTSPKLNDSTAVTITGTILNYLAGITYNVNNTISAMQAAIGIAAGQILALQNAQQAGGIYSATSTMVAGIKQISAATIAPQQNIDATKVRACFYKKNQDGTCETQDQMAIKLITNGIYLSTVEFNLSTRAIPDSATQFIFVIEYVTI